MKKNQLSIRLHGRPIGILEQIDLGKKNLNMHLMQPLLYLIDW